MVLAACALVAGCGLVNDERSGGVAKPVASRHGSPSIDTLGGKDPDARTDEGTTADGALPDPTVPGESVAGANASLVPSTTGGSTVPQTVATLGPADVPRGTDDQPIARTPQQLPMCSKVMSYLDAGGRFTASLDDVLAVPSSLASAGQQLVDALSEVVEAAPENDRGPIQALMGSMPPVVNAVRQARDRKAAVDVIRAYIGASKPQLEAAFGAMTTGCPGVFPQSPKLPNVADRIPI